MGAPGSASFGYIRVLPENKIKVGVEFWGVGAFESEALSVSSAAPIELGFSLPGFFPAPGNAGWGEVPGETQEKLRQELKISLNGADVLQRTVGAVIPRERAIYFGRNPIGGSLVTERFTGVLMQVSRLPLFSAR